MGFTRLAALAVAASVSWSWGGSAAADGPLRPFRHGSWSGGAYTDDRTGAFTHCSAEIADANGSNLFVLVTGEYRWWLGFINPKWSFAPDAKAQIRLRLDGGAPFDLLPTIPGSQILLVPLPDSSRLIDMFRDSSALVLDAEGQSFSFKLGETPAVIDRLTKCVQSSVALDVKAPAAASSTTAASGPEAKADPAAAALPPQAPAQARSHLTNPLASPAAATEAAASQPRALVDGGPRVAMSETSELPPPAGTVTVSSTAAQPLAAASPAGSPSLDTPSGAAAPLAAEGTPSGRWAAASQASPATSPAETPVPPMQPASPPRAAATADPEADGSPDRGGPPIASSAPVQPGLAAAQTPDAAVEARVPSSAPAWLAFTAVTPVVRTPPATESTPEPLSTTAIEEVRLATDFLAGARLPEARLVVADKPPALAEFAAVWRSEDAAGAVRIIPPGPDVSAIGIASHLIAVDPQVCNGDFSASRVRIDVGNRAVFSALLSCREADGQRATEYFIAPRRRGGFVVFAVIHSTSVGETPVFDRRRIEALSKAAIRAAEGQG